MKRIITLWIALFSFMLAANANNIQVNNVGITGQNIASQFTLVKFDLSWENSWRLSVGPSNWDAAWVFVKFRVNNGPWTHANLNYVNGTSDGHTVPGGVTVRTPADQTGVFIHRSVDGSGNVNWQNVQLRWNYGSNAVGNNDLVDVQVFAVEMVYVPQGAFVVGGTTGTEQDKFYTSPTTSNSYSISSEAAITVGTGTGNLYYTITSASSGDQLGPIPAAFPKGFNAFYCMKYEVSQDQWVSFFNSLTSTQKTARDITGTNGNGTLFRNTVSWSGTGNATTTTPNRAMTYIFWEDITAYMDWAALRPMTELEFEKAGRGPLPAVADEYAWGNSNIHGSVYTYNNDGTENEGFSGMGTGTGNALYGLTLPANGPARNGIFAASATNKNREETGGSYYGVMELSGNAWEAQVSVGTLNQRAFTGLHGNGIITSAGNSNTSGWSTNGGLRGGSSGSEVSRLNLSARRLASFSINTTRFSDLGFRAVRTAF